MAITRSKKADLLKQLKEKFGKAKVAVFVKFGGLEVKNVQKIRKVLREGFFDYQVAKKTLIRKAAEKYGYKDIPETILEGPIAVAFGYEDEIGPAKKVYEFTKEFETIKLMGALSDGKILDKNQIKELALIPSKMELLTKFAGMMKSPLYNFAGMLNSPLSSFLRAMKVYSEKKPAEK